MFIGHYGVSFAIKSRERSIPLWVLFVAVQFLDVFWGIFVLTGVEKVRIVPGFTATNPLDLYYMPYTHSLVGALFWSAVGFALYWLLRGRDRTAALLVGLAVFSHWLLDLVVHRPDLALYDDTYKMGLGLWDYPATAFGLEIVLLFFGIFLYLRSTTANDAIGKYGIPVLALFMIVAQSVVFFGSPPHSANAAAATAPIAYFVFAAAAFFIERRRS
jgi:membrane-bound metal-dependent hydrolase YbcI (DUF457 family)